MVSIEIKINGNLIRYINGINRGHTREDKNIYTYYDYDTSNQRVNSNDVKHKSEEGIIKLIEIICKDIVKRGIE